MFSGFEQYLLTEKRYSEHTLNAYLLDVRQFFEFLNEDLQVLPSLVNTADVRSWLVSLYDDGL